MVMWRDRGGVGIGAVEEAERKQEKERKGDKESGSVNIEIDSTCSRKRALIENGIDESALRDGDEDANVQFMFSSVSRAGARCNCPARDAYRYGSQETRPCWYNSRQ